MSEWIKCSERMPERGQKLLYFFDYTGISLGEFLGYDDSMRGLEDGQHNAVFGGRSGFLTGDVTHWMPIPEPPKAIP